MRTMSDLVTLSTSIRDDQSVPAFRGQPMGGIRGNFIVGPQLAAGLTRSRQIIAGIVAAVILGCCGIVGLVPILPGYAEPTCSQAVLELTDTSIRPADIPIRPDARGANSES